MVSIFRKWIDSHFSDPQVIVLWGSLIFGFLLFYLLGSMLTPVFAALIIAYLLDSLVSWMQRRRIPRIAAVLLVFTVFMTCLVLIMIWLIPLLSRQIAQLIQDLPSMIASVQAKLMTLPEKYPKFVSGEHIRQFFNFMDLQLTSQGQRILSWSLASVKGLITFIVYLILVPLMVFFFLKDKEKIFEWVGYYLPKNRGMANTVLVEVNRQTGNYVRGKIWEFLIIWFATYITFSLLRLRFAMLISMFVGLSVLIPYIGVTVMFLPVGLIGYFQWGWSTQLLYVMIAYSVIQLIDGNILAPLLLSGVVNLHPVAIIIAVLVFGGLWGVWGLFFAIPLATLCHAVLKVWFKAHAEKQKQIEEATEELSR